MILDKRFASIRGTKVDYELLYPSQRMNYGSISYPILICGDKPENYVTPSIKFSSSHVFLLIINPKFTFIEVNLIMWNGYKLDGKLINIWPKYLITRNSGNPTF